LHLWNHLAVKVDIKAFDFSFAVDPQADDDIDHFEDDVADDA
jgi:hypothetical protein